MQLSVKTFPAHSKPTHASSLLRHLFTLLLVSWFGTVRRPPLMSVWSILGRFERLVLIRTLLPVHQLHKRTQTHPHIGEHTWIRSFLLCCLAIITLVSLFACHSNKPAQSQVPPLAPSPTQLTLTERGSEREREGERDKLPKCYISHTHS